MKKRVLKIVGFIVLLIILSVLFLTLSIDYIVKSNIETTGSEVLQTQLTVDNVSISIFRGTGSIQGIKIANPDGYEEGDALTVLSLDLKMKPLSIFSNTVVIEDLEIQSLEILYRLQPGGSNLGTLNQNLQSHVPDPDKTTDVFVIIDRFLMEETSLTISIDIEGVEPVSATLPRVEHTGIGRNEETEAAEAMKIILESILTEAAREGRNRLIEEGGRRLLDEAGDALRDMFN